MTDLSLKVHRSGDFRITTFAYINEEGEIRFRAITLWITPGITILDTMHHPSRDQAKTTTSERLKKITENILAVNNDMIVGKYER